jgi:Zn-dependent peptidase ImmA (M78 family)
MIRTELPSEPLVRKLVRRHGGATPEEAIERYVTKCLSDTGQSRLPINVDLIASTMGIRQHIREYSFAGRIYADPNGQLVMDLNVGDPEPRRRFTCAHEVLHIAFPGFRSEARYRLDRTTGVYEEKRALEEYLCDLGASLMLMPAALVSKAYRVQDGLAAMKALQKAANVSLEAAGIRMVKLANIACAFLVLEVGHKPADARALRRGDFVQSELRVKYGVINGLSFVPKFKSVAPQSLFAQALHGSGHVTGFDLLPGAIDSVQNRMYVEAMRSDRKEGDREVQRVLAVAVAPG